MGFVKGGVNLNLGANDVNVRKGLGLITDGYVNVDIRAMPGVDVICDLNERWPWEDESVDFIIADNIFEHLKNPFHSMNEAWRVLKMGAEMIVRVPSTDGRGAFQDPTHGAHFGGSYWNANTFLYFSANAPDYHDLYPDLIHCTFDIDVGHTPLNMMKVIWVKAVCRKVPHAKPVVSDGVPADNGVSP